MSLKNKYKKVHKIGNHTNLKVECYGKSKIVMIHNGLLNLQIKCLMWGQK